MRASARRALLLAATLGAACVTRTRRLAPSGTATAAGMPDAIQEMAQAVLLDAEGDRAAALLADPWKRRVGTGLGVRRASLDRVADLCRRAGADDPQHEVEDETDGGEP